MEKISWTDRERNEEVLHRFKDRNIPYTLNRRKANWIGHILCRNCLLKHVIGGKIERKRRRERRCKQLLDDFKETRGYRRLKKEPLNRILWRTRFGSSYGHVRQTME
jgi:hypothetical protein